MSNNIIPRRLVTRSRVAIEEASSVAQEPSSISVTLPSDTTPHLPKDTQALVNENSLSTPENATGKYAFLEIIFNSHIIYLLNLYDMFYELMTASKKKGGRGASTGKSIEKAIVDNVIVDFLVYFISLMFDAP